MGTMSMSRRTIVAVICCFIVARRLLLGFDDLLTFSRGRSPFVMVAKLCFPSQYLSLDSCISANINIGVLTVVLTMTIITVPVDPLTPGLLLVMERPC